MQRKGTIVIRTGAVEKLRAQAGLSLEALAQKVPIDVRTLQRWLAGQPAWFENVASLAKALNVDYEAITQPINEASRSVIQLTLAVEATEYDEEKHLLPIIAVFKNITKSPYEMAIKDDGGRVIISVSMLNHDVSKLQAMTGSGAISCLADVGVDFIKYPDGTEDFCPPV